MKKSGSRAKHKMGGKEKPMDILTVQEVAQLLKCTPQTIWAKVRANKVPYFRIGEGGAIRFEKTALMEWARAQMGMKK